MTNPDEERRRDIAEKISSSKWICNHCRKENFLHPADNKRPLGRLICRNHNCKRPASTLSSFLSAPALEIITTHCVQIPSDPADRSTFGMACHECGTTFTVEPPPPSKGKMGFFGSRKRRHSPGHAVLLDFRNRSCPGCKEKCCGLCIRFRVRDNEPVEYHMRDLVTAAECQPDLDRTPPSGCSPGYRNRVTAEKVQNEMHTDRDRKLRKQLEAQSEASQPHSNASRKLAISALCAEQVDLEKARAATRDRNHTTGFVCRPPSPLNIESPDPERAGTSSEPYFPAPVAGLSRRGAIKEPDLDLQFATCTSAEDLSPTIPLRWVNVGAVTVIDQASACSSQIAEYFGPVPVKPGRPVLRVDTRDGGHNGPPPQLLTSGAMEATKPSRRKARTIYRFCAGTCDKHLLDCRHAVQTPRLEPCGRNCYHPKDYPGFPCKPCAEGQPPDWEAFVVARSSRRGI